MGEEEKYTPEGYVEEAASEASSEEREGASEQASPECAVAVDEDSAHDNPDEATAVSESVAAPEEDATEEVPESRSTVLPEGVDEREAQKAMLEVVLFLSGDPVSAAELKSSTGLSEADLVDLLDELCEDYAGRPGGIKLGRIAGGYQMYTDPRFSEWARKFRGTSKSQKLSMAALETLSIIAYKQPLTKVEVEEIRGVNADGVIKTLLDRRLIKIVGKKEAPGKPILYGTTPEFLQYFGLSDLAELPTVKDLEREEAA